MPSLAKKNPLRVGDVFLDKYQILGVVGKGGFGCVYKARSGLMGREVALKLILNEQGTSTKLSIERGRQEAVILGQLEHPNIVTVFDADVTPEGHLYIAMRLLKGQTLSARLRSGPLNVSEGLSLIEALCSALEFAHSKRIAHRDIKPGNIFLQDEGVPQLLDFGIAHVAGSSGFNTAPNEVIGTALYVSPEQLHAASRPSKGGMRPAYESSDIYALGLVAFQIFQGTHPFLLLDPSANFSTAQDAWKYHVKTLPPRLDHVVSGFPREVALLVNTALAKDPDQRIQSMAEFGSKARSARLKYINQNSSAYFVPLAPEPQSKSEPPAPSLDEQEHNVTAPLAPRGTQKLFNEDETTHYVEIPQASFMPRSSRRPAQTEQHHESQQIDPDTHKTVSKTIPGLTRRVRGFPPIVFAAGGAVVGLFIWVALLPLLNKLSISRADALQPGEIVIEAIEPLPTRVPASTTEKMQAPTKGDASEAAVPVKLPAEPPPTPVVALSAPKPRAPAAPAPEPIAHNQSLFQIKDDAPSQALPSARNDLPPAPQPKPAPIKNPAPSKNDDAWKDELTTGPWLE